MAVNSYDTNALYLQDITKLVKPRTKLGFVVF